MTIQFNPEQTMVINALGTFLADKTASFFMIRGPAGSGKTTCLLQVIARYPGRFIFTAPTNKATRVLRTMLTSDTYKPECKTVYSVLGLKLLPSGEVKELSTLEDDIDISKYTAIIVDEASMLSKRIYQDLRLAVKEAGIKCILLGDASQLPPVNEGTSPIWLDEENLTVGTLTKIERFDNQILPLSKVIREKIGKQFPSFNFKSDNCMGQGVWVQGRLEFAESILCEADYGYFQKIDHSKVIAWRNVTVDRYNKLIRDRIFPGAVSPWVVGDRIILTHPARDLGGNTIAHTDDEGIIESVTLTRHEKFGDFDIYLLGVRLDTNEKAYLSILRGSSRQEYEEHVEYLKASKRPNTIKWPAFWDFVDAFHNIKYAYAITAHRSQGSTYKTAYVDTGDILMNKNTDEALKCLYVACTRAKNRLFLL